MAPTHLSLTYVQYDDEWWASRFLAYATLTPLALVFALFGFIAARRELEAIALAVGLFGNEVANQILKRIIRQPRPVGSGQRTSYGMPSSHTQFCFFFTLYFILWIQTRVSFSEPYGTWLKRTLTAGAVFASLVIGASRIHLGEHSAGQVLCGACVGTVIGIAYHVLLQWYARPHYAWLESLWCSRQLYLKDSAPHANVLRLEYEHHLLRATEVRQRTKKTTTTIVTTETTTITTAADDDDLHHDESTYRLRPAVDTAPDADSSSSSSSSGGAGGKTNTKTKAKAKSKTAAAKPKGTKLR